VLAAAGPDEYYLPPFNDQGNWMAPNLTAGDAILTFEITDKPSSLAIHIQVCAWSLHNGKNFNDGFEETCSDRTEFTDETLAPVVINLGAPAAWWQRNGFFPWTTGPHLFRIMIKDAATQSLLMSTHCGTHCWTGAGPISPHVPITLRSTLTFNN